MDEAIANQIGTSAFVEEDEKKIEPETTPVANLMGTTATTQVNKTKVLSLKELDDEVRCLVAGTSQKFVPHPSGER